MTSLQTELVGATPHPVTVSRTFSRESRNPYINYKPSVATATGWGVDRSPKEFVADSVGDVFFRLSSWMK